MKNIILIAHDDEGQEARLQAALDVTRAVEGHLTCLGAMVPPAALTYDVYSGALAAELIAQERETDAANRSRVEARLANEDVSWNWSDTSCFPADAVEASSGLADLVVVSSHLGENEAPEIQRLTSAVADRSGRPVLAVPTGTRSLDVTGTALVAWDGSHEADEALRDAVPLLKLAKDVVLLELDQREGAFAATAAASYLSRHGIHPRIEAGERSADERVWSAILDKAHEVQAAYIVMGAYGHSPAVETVFGGVTRSMLAHTDVPLFLAH